jgi:phosphate transport system protein
MSGATTPRLPMADSNTAHTDRDYERELRLLRERLVLMAGRVETMIADSVRALLERDPDLARRTIETDHKVNRAEIEIDEACLVILARRQPMASDLRFVTTALKMVTDVERIGDLAVNVCERAIDLSAFGPLEVAREVSHVASLMRWMMRDAIDSFIEADSDKAEGVVRRDDEVDEAYHRFFRGVLQRMILDPGEVERGIHVLSAAKYLERMADHATNLAEQVVFLVRALDVRHSGKLDE